MVELLATTDILAEQLGEAPRARRGEVFEADDAEAAALIDAGLAVASDSPDAALHRDARAMWVGQCRE